MPFIAVVFFFSKSPRFIPLNIIKAKLIALFLLSIILPILIFYLLKSLKQAENIYLQSTKERIIPLLLNCIIIGYLNYTVFPPNEFIELHYFFIGIVFSSLSCLILAILKFKASIHMIASTGVLMFFIALSIHYSINIIGTIALLFILIGAIATSRLHMRAHSVPELIVGTVVGIVPQLILLKFWL
jgi:hypothetical protein